MVSVCLRKPIRRTYNVLMEPLRIQVEETVIVRDGERYVPVVSFPVTDDFIIESVEIPILGGFAWVPALARAPSMFRFTRLEHLAW